jgi:hypothetical protein
MARKMSPMMRCPNSMLRSMGSGMTSMAVETPLRVIA